MNPDEKACMRKVGPDCKFIKAAMSYWCTNKACCRSRGTTIPGIVGCPYYRAVPTPSQREADFHHSLAVVVLLAVMVTVFLTILASMLV